MDILIEVLGWIGSLAVVLAYGLNSSKKVKSDSLIFQLLNFTGALLLIINSLSKKAYPFTFINTVWLIIALVALVGMMRKGRNQPH